MNSIYKDIAERTNGNIYLGVVGPVRTGKSTFITRFMEKMVIPNLEDGAALNRTKDELPQSGSGNLIMTTQPRFVPNEAVQINIGKASAKVRLVDCVGYLIDGVSGHVNEDGSPRMVKTPWQEEKLPFEMAAEIGTGKVITDHSTIGVLVTTDGTISGIDRTNYVDAEERAIKELKALNKPFVVILNSLSPLGEEAEKLKKAMEEKYKTTVLVKNVALMEEEDFVEVLKTALYEFPITEVQFYLPDWMRSLSEDNKIIEKILSELTQKDFNKMSDYKGFTSLFSGDPEIFSPSVKNMNLATGVVEFEIIASEELYYKTLSELTGTNLTSGTDLMEYIINASMAKQKFEKLEMALLSAEEKGYGVVMPYASDMELSPPEVITKSNSSALKLKAKAPSYHIIKVDVETEVSPAVGGGIDFAQTGEEPIMENSEVDAIWNTSMFGKTLTEIAHDGIVSKLNTFPKEAEKKLQKTVSKITNEGKGGIICILL